MLSIRHYIHSIPQAGAAMEHIGLMTGRGAKKGLWPKVNDWLAERSN
ncbi:MAG: hypothetical protein ACRDSJ_25375 [Rubrobacteraceae bacterium]